MARRRRRNQWSYLPGELLELILEKLDLVAHARFASVCSSWRSIAVENPPINKPLYLALSQNPEHLVRRFITSFVPSWNEGRFIGALDGWLVIFIDRRDLFLLNKGFNSMIPLPSPPKDLQISFQRRDFCKAVLSSSPPLPASSSGECTVVISRRRSGLFYCRLGSDNSFTNVLDARYIILDVQFYKGRLYVLCDPNIIIIFDHLFNRATQLVAHFRDITTPVSLRVLKWLISEDKLRMIAKCLNPIRVFKFKRSKSKVFRVKNINENRLLLINDFCSVSIAADNHKEFRPKNYDGFRNKHDTCVLYTDKDPHEATAGDLWPLFFSMFKHIGVNKNL